MSVMSFPIYSAQVEALKKQGNEALGKGHAEEAIRLYTDAIELDPDNHVLFSNRSAAFAKLNKFAEALKDAEKTVELKPNWPKASGGCYMTETQRECVSLSLSCRATPGREQPFPI